jgi:hypothetical protein
MGVEADILNALTTYSALTTLVSAKIYPAKVPQAVTPPAITYRVVDGGRINDLSGFSGLSNPHIAIDCFSTSYSQVCNISTAIIQAITASTRFKAIMQDNPVDEYDDEIEVHRRILDFSLWL